MWIFDSYPAPLSSLLHTHGNLCESAVTIGTLTLELFSLMCDQFDWSLRRCTDHFAVSYQGFYSMLRACAHPSTLILCVSLFSSIGHVLFGTFEPEVVFVMGTPLFALVEAELCVFFDLCETEQRLCRCRSSCVGCVSHTPDSGCPLDFLICFAALQPIHFVFSLHLVVQYNT